MTSSLLDKSVKIAAFVLLSLVLLYYGKPFLTPLLIASLLAMLLLPLCARLERHIHPVPAALVALLLLLTATGLLVFLFSLQLSELSEKAPEIGKNLSAKLAQAKDFLTDKFGISPGRQQEIIGQQEPSSAGRLVTLFTALFASLGSLLTDFIIVMVYVFLLLLLRSHLKGFVLKLVAQNEQAAAELILHDVRQVAQKYLSGLALMIACLWVMYGIGFSLIGVQHALFFAVLCGLLEIVPFVGNLTGVSLTILMTLATGGSTGMIAGILVAYGVIQFTQTYLLEPLVVGKVISINPLFTIMSIIAGELLWGVAGMILALPLLGMLKIVCDHIPPLKPFGFLIGEAKAEGGGRRTEDGQTPSEIERQNRTIVLRTFSNAIIRWLRCLFSIFRLPPSVLRLLPSFRPLPSALCLLLSPPYFCRMAIEELYRIYQRHPSVQTDTRRLRNGDLYFALKGPNFNGNAFAQKALDGGAAYAVIDEAAHAVEGKTILVEDVLQTLQQLALHHRKQFDIPFLAITGSNGKTTTKELIHAVLSTTFKTATTEGNLNNHIGVPLTILKIRSDAEMAVIEMGANHQKEIEAYCVIALPTHGLITNVGKAHLEGFGSEEGVRRGKGELFEFIRAHNGGIFRMNDYGYLHEMSQGIADIFTYGTKEGDVVGEAVQSDPFLKVRFTAGFAGEINTSLVGSYNLPNVLAAVAVGKKFGVSDEKTGAAIEAYAPSNSRSQWVQKGGNKIILDAYNANPSSMKAAVENFARAEGANKVLVLGAMAELGAESLTEHKALIAEIEKHPWKDVLLVGGDFLRSGHPFLSFAAPDEAGAWLQAQNIRDAFLLIKGSRSMQMEKVLNYL